MMTATARTLAQRQRNVERTTRDKMLSDLHFIPPGPHTRRRAALAVCGNAVDTADARLLLEALGLLGDPAVTAPEAAPAVPAPRLRDPRRQ